MLLLSTIEWYIPRPLKGARVTGSGKRQICMINAKGTVRHDDMFLQGA